MGESIHNTPIFPAYRAGMGFQEVWYLRLNDPVAGNAVWLRYTVLKHDDSSVAKAEIWGIFFKAEAFRIKKYAAKSSFPLDEFKIVSSDCGAPAFRIDKSVFSNTRVQGEASSGGTRIVWELEMQPILKKGFSFVPEILEHWGLVKNIAWTVQEHAIFNGWTEVNGTRVFWHDAPGMQGHLAGPRNGHSWVWGHCNMFVDDKGDSAPIVWDGLCARAQLGSRIIAPPVTAMYLRYREKDYRFNRLRDSFKVKSRYGLEGWDFVMNSPELRIHGVISSRLQDYAGITYEDTDGSHLYCHNSKVSDMEMTLTPSGDGARRYHARGCAAYEVVTRTLLPGVDVIL